MGKNIRRATSAARSQWTGDDWDEHFIANCVGSQRLVSYLEQPGETLRWAIEDAHDEAAPHTSIVAVKIGNRTGTPQGSATWRYTVTGAGFGVTIRAVWHAGTLLGPLKTHCKVTLVVPNTQDARRAYNEWLRSLALV
jgi:hypothetical protein